MTTTSTTKPTEEPCLDSLPPVVLYPAGPGLACRGLCLVVQASSDPDAAAYDATARRLQTEGVMTVVSEMPRPDDPRFGDPICGIVERQKRILALFAFVQRHFPELPAVVLASNDGALCALALLKVDRASTCNIRALVVAGSEIRVISTRRDQASGEDDKLSTIVARMAKTGTVTI